jgi:hypothetical protein
MKAKVIGVHPLPVTEELFRKTVEWRYGEGLKSKKLAKAEAQIRDWFDNLYLIEVEVDPPDRSFIDDHPPTQEIKGVPQDNWQVAYDERAMDEDGRSWAFFLHFVDLKQPLITKAGRVPLPPPTPLPKKLADLLAKQPYEAP